LRRAIYDDAADAAAKAEADRLAAEKQAAEGKKFTQEEVNKFLAEDRRKAQKQREDLITQLSSLRETATLTEQQKKELEDRISNLQAEGQTKEQLQKGEIENLRKTLEKAQKDLGSERDAWRNRFTDAEITRAITDAAVEAGAFSPAQLVLLLKGNTRLVEALGEDGKPTGNLVPKITYEDVDKDNKPIKLDLAVSESMKRMVATPKKYGNLFKSTAAGGLGGSNAGGSSGADDGKPPINDAAKYREFRKTHPEFVGTPK